MIHYCSNTVIGSMEIFPGIFWTVGLIGVQTTSDRLSRSAHDVSLKHNRVRVVKNGSNNFAKNHNEGRKSHSRLSVAFDFILQGGL